MAEKILTIVGPTASGKTSLAIDLAKKINGEVISLDSRQIYKGMCIGTAQPTREERLGVKHHLIGCFQPSKYISSGKYFSMVKEKISEIKKQNKKPIICGGSGLYYRAIQKGIFKGSKSNLQIRDRLDYEYLKNPQILYEKLKSIDEEYSKIVHINNKQRLIRALEIFETTGKSPSDHFQSQKINPVKTIKLYTVFLKWERNTINTRINDRTKEMFKQGWIREVKNLLELQKEHNKEFPSLNSIGYKHIKAYLNSEITKDNMLNLITIRTRQFARRQEKWFKKEPIDLYLQMDQLEKKKIPEILDCFLERIL